MSRNVVFKHICLPEILMSKALETSTKIKENRENVFELVRYKLNCAFLRNEISEKLAKAYLNLKSFLVPIRHYKNMHHPGNCANCETSSDSYVMLYCI